MALQESVVDEIKVVYGRDPTRQGFYWSDSQQKRQEILTVKRFSPADFESVYQGHPGARIGSIFLASDIDVFFNAPLGLLGGMGIESAEIARFCQHGHGIIQAWDTAFSTTFGSAWTVCTTGLFIPCQKYHRGEDPLIWGPCDFHFDVAILDVFREKLDWGDLNKAFRMQRMKWNPLEVLVEKKASGISLIQAWKNSDFPITEVAVDGWSKKARALNSVTAQGAGSVQGWCRQHRVYLPEDDDKTKPEWYLPWRTEMMDFSGEDDTSNDQVDATVHLVTRAITMGSGMATLPTDWDPSKSAIPLRANDMSPITMDMVDPRMAVLFTIGQMMETNDDPFYGTCGRCDKKGSKQVCPVTHKLMLAHDSCPEYDDSEGATALL